MVVALEMDQQFLIKITYTVDITIVGIIKYCIHTDLMEILVFGLELQWDLP